MKKFITAVALVGLVVGLCGCVVAMGNRDGWRARGAPTTLGQELMDLKKAKETGAISDAEYEAARRKLLGEDERK